MTGKIYNISPAPPKSKLTAFGGDMSIIQYRKCFNSDESYIELPNHMIISNPVVEKVHNFSWIKSDNANKTYQDFDKTNVDNSNTMTLKRSAPIKHEQNTLESSMGLFKVS